MEGADCCFFIEAFCHLSPDGPRSGGMHCQGVTQGVVQDAGATKPSVLPAPGTATAARRDRAQAFDSHGAARGTMEEGVLVRGRC